MRNSRNLFHVLWNISTVVLVPCKGHSCEFGIFVQSVGSVSSLFCCGEGGGFELRERLKKFASQSHDTLFGSIIMI